MEPSAGAAAVRAVAIVALALVMTACATGSATDQELRVLRDDIAALRASIDRAAGERERSATTLDQTIARQAQESSARTDTLAAALADVTRRVDALSHHAEGEADRIADQRRFVTDSVDSLGAKLSPFADSLAVLDGRLTVLDARVAALDERLASLDQRIAALPPQQTSVTPPAASSESGAAAVSAVPGPTPPPAPAVPGAEVATPHAATPVDRPPGTSGRPRDIYDAAYIDFGRGSYALAIGGFGEFLRRFPDDPLAANAQYWIGEAHLGLARSYENSGNAERANQERRQAVQALASVVERYPHSDKAPVALYREALILFEQGEDEKAREQLQRLITSFPAAAETPLARERLARGRE
jgi:tol-pal system protein YbgF